MKKIISVIIAAAVFISSVSVFADGNLIADGIVKERYEYDPTDYVISFDGKINGEVKAIPVTMKVFDNTGALFAAKQVFSDADDNTFNFNMYLPIDKTSGTYKVTISEMFYGTEVDETFGYTGIGELFTAVKTITEGVASVQTNGVVALIEPYKDILNIDVQLYSNLLPQAQQYALNHIKSVPYNVPDNIDTDEKRNELRQAAVDLRQAYMTAVAIGQYEDIKNVSDAQSWLSKYFSQYNFGTDDLSTPTNETLLYAEYQKESSDTVFLNKLTATKGLQTLDTIRNAIYDCILVSIVKTEYRTEAQRVVGAYPAFFPIDTTDMGSLTPNEQTEIYSQLSYYEYSNCADVADKIDELVDAKIISKGQGGNGNVGNNGGGSGGGGNFSVGLKPAETQPEEVKPNSFDDLETVSWAEKEITYLAEKSIINGKGNNKFYPNDNVTRAEFLKMLSVSMGFNVENLTNFETDFVDVNINEWYFPYVAYCEQKGIVKGNDNGQFLPDDKITRQDIAVMIHRAVFGSNDDYQIIEFSDNDNISDYAVSAVACLYNNGIVKGDQNNHFEPQNNSTRAEAAVMIYRTFFE